jgi:hypothetical protein
MFNDIFKSVKFAKSLLSVGWKSYYLLAFDSSCTSSLLAGLPEDSAKFVPFVYGEMVKLQKGEDSPYGVAFNGNGAICLGWENNTLNYITSLVMHWLSYNKPPEVNIRRTYKNLTLYEQELERRGWLARKKPETYEIQTGTEDLSISLAPGKDERNILEWHFHSIELLDFLRGFLSEAILPDKSVNALTLKDSFGDLIITFEP